MSPRKPSHTIGHNPLDDLDALDPALVTSKARKGRKQVKDDDQQTVLRIRVPSRLAERLQRLVTTGAAESLDELASTALAAYTRALTTGGRKQTGKTKAKTGKTKAKTGKKKAATKTAKQKAATSAGSKKTKKKVAKAKRSVRADRSGCW